MGDADHLDHRAGGDDLTQDAAVTNTHPTAWANSLNLAAFAPLVLVVGRRGERQLSTYRLDPVSVRVLIDETTRNRQKRWGTGYPGWDSNSRSPLLSPANGPGTSEYLSSSITPTLESDYRPAYQVPFASMSSQVSSGSLPTAMNA